MIREGIFHRPMSEYAHGISETRVVIRLRAVKDDLKSVKLYYGDRACRQNPVLYTPLKMDIVFSDLLFDWWEVEFDTLYKRVCYYFELTCEKECILYYADLFTDKLTTERSEVFQLPFVHRADIASVPDWVHDAVIYNIFPDSFATGKKYISLEPTEKVWKDQVVRGKLGGTIKGITKNVDYLRKLGINCIYINPLFAAGEYHKYDLLDYYNVDPCFGTNEEFAEMVDTLHNNGIRVIIDGVFNHCGWRFFAFNDAVEKGEDSQYADWFYGLKHPIVRPDNQEDIPTYECFAYERLMPKINTANPEVEKYFCDVGRYWVKNYNIDGWRLDVANETNDGFWRAFRRAVKEENPEAVLIGEIWENANHWLDGSMFHAGMNYDFRRHCRDFFARSTTDATEFADRVINMLMRYRKNMTYGQLNLLDSHDVSRFLTLCNEDKKRFKLAVIFQMCFVGIPSVFYGDEQGISGLKEDEYRQPMTWDGDKELFEFYQDAIKMRHDNIPLRRGDFKILEATNSLFAFRREYGGKQVTVALNAGENSVVFNGQTIDAFSYFMSLQE